MKNKVLLAGIILFFSGSLFCISEKSQALNPQNCELAFDAHLTLVKPSKLSMARIGLTQGGPRLLAYIFSSLTLEVVKYPWKREGGKTCQLLGSIYKTLKQVKNPNIEDFKAAFDAYDARLWPLAITMAAEHAPIDGMQELLDELHSLGYTLRIATNMSVAEYAAARQRNRELFSHFQGGVTVDVAQAGCPRKPSVAYFERYHELYNNDRSKSVIFVDDKEKNTRPAEQAGMIGIVYKDTRSLRTQLENLGILQSR